MNRFNYIITLALLTITLSGCMGSTEESFDSSEIQREMPIKRLSDISGDWNIIRFDDYKPSSSMSFEGKPHAFVIISNNIVSFGIECNSAGMPAKLTSSGILKNRSKYDGIIRTNMGCPKEIGAREDKLVRFFDDRPKITRLSKTQLRLATKSHELIIQKKNN